MSNKENLQPVEINDEVIDKVAGGQEEVTFLFQEHIVTCPECGKEITIHGNYTGTYMYLICPHCTKSFTIKI